MLFKNAILLRISKIGNHTRKITEKQKNSFKLEQHTSKCINKFTLMIIKTITGESIKISIILNKKTACTLLS